MPNGCLATASITTASGVAAATIAVTATGGDAAATVAVTAATAATRRNNGQQCRAWLPRECSHTLAIL